jgi:hypothetical protein
VPTPLATAPRSSGEVPRVSGSGSIRWVCDRESRIRGSSSARPRCRRRPKSAGIPGRGSEL